MDHNRLITQPVISDNASGYHEMNTMKMVEDDDAFLFLATWTQQIKKFTAGSMENRRRPKGQPDAGDRRVNLTAGSTWSVFAILTAKRMLSTLIWNSLRLDSSTCHVCIAKFLHAQSWRADFATMWQRRRTRRTVGRLPLVNMHCKLEGVRPRSSLKRSLSSWLKRSMPSSGRPCRFPLIKVM